MWASEGEEHCTAAYLPILLNGMNSEYLGIHYTVVHITPLATTLVCSADESVMTTDY